VLELPLGVALPMQAAIIVFVVSVFVLARVSRTA
jgi:hypothetical protein